MRFLGFHIKNFRGIKDLTVNLDRIPEPNVFALVGLNESGKSTILHALDWLRNPQNYSAPDLIPKGLRANFNDSVSVEARLKLSEADYKELGRVANEAGYILEGGPTEFTVTRRYVYSNSVRQPSVSDNTWSLRWEGRRKAQRKLRTIDSTMPIWKTLVAYIRDELLPPIIYYENFLFDIPDKIYLERADEKLTREDMIYRDVVQDVLTSLNMNLNVEEHLLARLENASRQSLDNIQAVLDEASHQLTDVVISAWREIVKRGDDRLEVSLGNGIEEDETGKYLQLKVKEGKQTFYIRERSLGFRWFFGFVLFTHFRTFRDNRRRNALFLLDEPASNLHPAAQTKLLSAFASLPNHQVVIYSTHSHHMVKPEWLSGAYVVRNEGQNPSGLDMHFNASLTDIHAERYFNFVARHPHDTDLYRPILEALDYRPSPLDRVPAVTIVEGKNDYYTLRYMLDVGGLGETGELAVYPAMGKDKIADIVGLYLAWGRPFVVLLDDDKGGAATAARLKRDFGLIVEERVLTYRDVDPRWKGNSMEDLFSDKERERIVQSTFPNQAVTKSKFNASLQALLVNDKAISISKTTLSRFTKLISALRSRLEASVEA